MFVERKYWHGPILKATVNERTIGLDKWAGVVGLSRPRKSSICPSDRRTMTQCWPVSSIVKRLAQFLSLIWWKRESNIRKKGLKLWKAFRSKKQRKQNENLPLFTIWTGQIDIHLTANFFQVIFLTNWIVLCVLYFDFFLQIVLALYLKRPSWPWQWPTNPVPNQCPIKPKHP